MSLETINLLAFPDWNRAEEDICNDLTVMMSRLCKIEQSHPISLLLTTNNLDDLERGNFILSAAGMELMMNEDLDITDYLDVSLLDKLSPLKCIELLPKLHGRISLELEDSTAMDQFDLHALDRVNLIDFLGLESQKEQSVTSKLKLNLDVTNLKNISEYAALKGIAIFVHATFFEIFRAKRVLRISIVNAVYLMDMINSFDYYFDAVSPIEIDDYFVVDYSTPRYHKLCGFDEIPYLFPSLSEPYITISQYLDFANLSTGGVVLDMGAYSGITSIMFGRVVGNEGKVYAFEPDPLNYACFNENIKIARAVSGLENISIIKKAVWKNSLGIEFSSEGAMGSSAAEIVGSTRGNVITVPSISIADFCEQNAIEKIDFIKMDIEGGEINVLESSKEILEKLRPKMIIEPHYVGNELSTSACQQILESIGYEVNLITQYGVPLPLIEATPQ
jgi:FkbM family methyltransferase